MAFSSKAVPILVLCIGVTAISFGSIFVRLCDAPPLLIAAYRLMIATLVLIPFQFQDSSKQSTNIPSGRSLYYFLAGLFLALHFAAWITSLKYTSVASSVVLVTTNPLFVALLSWMFLREKITPRLILGMALTVVGGIFIARADAGAGRDTLKGDALALAGALMMSSYLLIGRVVRATTSLTRYVFQVYATAAVILGVLCLFTESNWFHYSKQTFLFFALSALVPQSIGHTSLNWALRYFPAAWVAVCALFEPFGAALLALVIFGETLTAQKVLGGVILLTGIFLSMVKTHAPAWNQIQKAAY